jgi:hypothetical protein
MSKNLRRDVTLGEAPDLGILHHRKFGWIERFLWFKEPEKIDNALLSLGSGGPDWIRTSDPALIKRML